MIPFRDIPSEGHTLFLSVLLITSVCIYSAVFLAPSLAVAEPTVEDQRSTAAIKRIMRVTEQGVFPSTLKLTKLDSSVFVFNDQTQQSLDMSIGFGSNRIHCHSPRLKLGEDGVFRTTQPVPPNSFVIACFPSAGKYPVEVKRASDGTTLHRATILVE